MLTGVTGLGACVHSAVYSARAEARHPPKGEQVEVNGHAVHLVERGEAGAPAVLMIHGASANASEFAWTLAPRLEDRFHVLMADRPGHGYSGRPKDGHLLEVQAQQLAGALDEVGVEDPVILVGHSFGGAVALRLALDHPDKVDGLVLLAPVTNDWGGDGIAWYNRWAAHPLLGPLFAQLAPIAGPGQARGGVASTFHPALAPDGYYENSAIGLLFRPPTFRANGTDIMHVRPQLIEQQARYGELDVPIIVFSGAKDRVINPTLHVGQLKTQAPNVELVKLPDGGHMPHHAHGEAVAEAIARLASAPDQR